jgi:hypothetical protein
MESDQQVSVGTILRSLLQLRRQGSTRMLQDLEQHEPELASYMMENLSLVHQRLSELIGPQRPLRRVQRQIEHLLLVCIDALRQGQYELWRKQNEPETPEDT